MEEAKAMARGSSESSGKPLVVCVEYFAGWCFACRSLHPKMTKIASEEFADVLFLRVRKDECPSLCDAMGVEKLPYVHLVSIEGADAVAPKIADAFAVPHGAKAAGSAPELETHVAGGAERREPAAWHKDQDHRNNKTCINNLSRPRSSIYAFYRFVAHLDKTPSPDESILGPRARVRYAQDYDGHRNDTALHALQALRC